jgi:1-acyl-sn-glycerol-3-phosphate acyltransferase
MRLLPPRPLRRLLLPVDVVVLLGLAITSALVSVVGLLAVPLTSRRRALRLSSFALAYCTMELAVITAAGVLWLRRAGRRPVRPQTQDAWITANQNLLAWALELVLGASRRCFGFQVVVVDPSDPTTLAETDPVLVLARHGGPGDSFALVHLLLTRYRRRVRIVLKDILQLDPALDLLLNRLGCCFLPAPSGDATEVTASLGALARDLGAGDALLLFPEGGNWTPDRRRRAIRRLQREHRAEAARAAALMTNVLPPRPGGVLACLAAHPGLDVVMVAHAGLDRVVRFGQAWNQLPLRTPMTVRAWRAAEVPDDEDQRLAWLTLEWAVVDEWVEARRAETSR